MNIKTDSPFLIIVLVIISVFGGYASCMAETQQFHWILLSNILAIVIIILSLYIASFYIKYQKIAKMISPNINEKNNQTNEHLLEEEKWWKERYDRRQ